MSSVQPHKLSWVSDPLVAAQMTITASKEVIAKVICKRKTELIHNDASIGDGFTLALCGGEVKHFLHLNRRKCRLLFEQS